MPYILIFRKVRLLINAIHWDVRYNTYSRTVFVKFKNNLFTKCEFCLNIQNVFSTKLISVYSMNSYFHSEEKCTRDLRAILKGHCELYSVKTNIDRVWNTTPSNVHGLFLFTKQFHLKFHLVAALELSTILLDLHQQQFAQLSFNCRFSNFHFFPKREFKNFLSCWIKS